VPPDTGTVGTSVAVVSDDDGSVVLVEASSVSTCSVVTSSVGADAATVSVVSVRALAALTV
jgi:hypothetical protein